jgi:hypothetical protein
MVITMRKGWFNQSYRHSLASKGIRTSSGNYADVGTKDLMEQIEKNNNVAFKVGKFNKKLASDKLFENDVIGLELQKRVKRGSMAGIEEQGLLRAAAEPLVQQRVEPQQQVEPQPLVQPEPQLVPQQVVEPEVPVREEYLTLGDVLRDIDKNTLESQHKPGAYKNFGDLLKEIQKAAFGTKVSGKKASNAGKKKPKEEYSDDEAEKRHFANWEDPVGAHRYSEDGDEE